MAVTTRGRLSSTQLIAYITIMKVTFEKIFTDKCSEKICTLHV